jgi:nitrogen regulatory protein P-II 1
MKKIEAILPPHLLDVVKEALWNAGAPGMTVTEIRGFSRKNTHTDTYRGATYRVEFLSEIKVEAVVGEEQVDRAVDAVFHAARSGEHGGGKVLVVPLEDVIRIRTGERGRDAL